MKDTKHKRIFLDYAAGRDNPNAIYKEGREAATRLARVRKTIAGVISAAPDEIVLTSWGTDANRHIQNMFCQTKVKPSRRFNLRGQGRPHVVTTQIEHESLLDIFRDLEKSGVEVTYLAPDKFGFISAEQVEKALRPNTRLVSIMYANNEIGTIQPIKEIARMLRKAKPDQRDPQVLGKNPQTVGLAQVRVLLHSDCVQAPGLLPINMQSLGLDLASFSAPKFGGPAGAGFMYKRRSVEMPSLRENVAVNLAEEMCDALVQAESRREKEVARLTKLRDYFINKVLIQVSDTCINGSRENRLANNVNFVLPIESELMVIELDNAGVAVSGGAACSAGHCEEGSHVIIALGKSKQDAKSSVRFSLGVDTKKSDLDYVIKILPEIINRHKNIWPSPKRQ